MSSLTTRTQAERAHRRQLLAPAPRPLHQRAAYPLLIAALRWLAALTFLAVVGAALWPQGQPTRPLAISPPEPAEQQQRVSNTQWYYEE